MRRSLMTISTSAFAVLTVTAAARADAVTTRIETRPYYGAVVTIEQGVRVWRALPPHDRIIILPEGAGKVNVNIDASSSRRAARAPQMNSNVNINNSGNGYGGAVGIPLSHSGHYGHRPLHPHTGVVGPTGKHR